MGRIIRLRVLIVFLTGLLLVGQLALTASDKAPQVGWSTPSPPSASDVQPYFFPSSSPWGWFGGYYSPFVNVPTLPPARPYLPKYWWVEPYPSADPRQAGYNPASGYAKDEVTTLLLVTSPAKARVILDGLYVGTADYLGPIQLPLGEHTLRVEAAGYEPSETVLSVEAPALQQLEVRLKPQTPAAKPEARR